jgi:hypothetical protein
MERRLKPLIVGKDPREVEPLYPRMELPYHADQVA